MRPLVSLLTATLVAHAAVAGTAAAQAHGVNHGSQGVSPEVLAAMRARGAAKAPAAARVAARELVITARDFAYDMPDTVEAGVTAVRLLNRGTELHHTQIIRLDAGKTMADVAAALQAGGPPPAWAHDAGGPNTPPPGGESVATLDLQPARYLVACFIPSPDGKPHVAKGMMHELVVTPARRASAVAAAATAPKQTLTLKDYGFVFSTPLRAGTQTVRVRNAAAQSHEVFIVKLAPGKTVQQLAAWVEKMDGPPPAEPIGGTTAMATGAWNDLTLTLAPGEYGLLCFIPDAKDGKPHVAHGMLQQISVK